MGRTIIYIYSVLNKISIENGTDNFRAFENLTDLTSFDQKKNINEIISAITDFRRACDSRVHMSSRTRPEQMLMVRRAYEEID